MQSFTQQRFLGASIRYFDVNLGWAGQETVLEIGLVEDPRTEDYFDPPTPGSLLRFNYDNWAFDGILDNFSASYDHSGNRVITVTITDPRRILNGVQMILSGYNDLTYGVRNIYNVYGYLESFGYGYSEINDMGLPYYKVVQALKDLTSQTKIIFNSVEYLFDFDTLPKLDPYYRFSGSNMSFMDFINEVCEIGNFDYFVKSRNGILSLGLVDRKILSSLGSINRFLDSLDPDVKVNQITQGIELEQNVGTKFIVGGQVEEVMFQPFINYSSGVSYIPTVNSGVAKENYYDLFAQNPIWPYWGLDSNYNAVLGQGYEVETSGVYYPSGCHKFTLDGSQINYPLIDFRAGYKSDVTEMRCALISQDAWSSLLAMANDLDKEQHYQKHRTISQVADIKKNIVSKLKTDPAKTLKMLAKDYIGLTLDDFYDADDQQKELVSRIYNFVKIYATEYYGRKFMIQVPDVAGKIDPDTLELTTSIEPSESGWMNEEFETEAVLNRFLPFLRDFIKDENGKITAYARFSGWQSYGLNLAELTEEDYLIEGDFVYVKCEVEPKLVFLNRATLYSPRIVITLPAPVYRHKRDRLVQDEESMQLVEEIFNKYKQDNNIDPISFDKAVIGINSIFSAMAPLALVPDLVCVPLKYNYRTYGPWYAYKGTVGTVEFEKNEDLVPWNFGGFTAMNQAGLALVKDVFTEHFIGENGSVTLPGAPQFELGTTLIEGGPYVTSIQVGFGENGVTTTYRMNRWTTKLGKDNKQKIEEFKKTYKLKVEQRRALSKLFKHKAPLKTYGRGRIVALPDRRAKPNSPNQLICAEVVEQNGLDVASVVTVPFYDVNAYLKKQSWDKKAGCSLDGIYYPFSTNSGNEYMPHYNPITYSGYVQQHRGTIGNFRENYISVGVVFNGSSGSSGVIDINNDFFSGGINEDHRSDLRPVGMRYPINIVESDLTKRVGPLDTQYSNNRGVWVADDMHTVLGMVLYGIQSSGYGEIVAFSNNLLIDQPDDMPPNPVSPPIILKNYLTDPSFYDQAYLVERVKAANYDIDYIPDGQLVKATKIGGIYIIDRVYCFNFNTLPPENNT